VQKYQVSEAMTSAMSTGLARARAVRALAEVGLPSDGLVRADSVTNEVWFTGSYVVRVNRDASPRLYREAVLSQVLPSEVGYPPIVQHGGEIGSDWLILERIPGVPLSRAWPNMTMQQRRRAVSQLADRLKVIHSTICPRLDGLGSVPQLLDSAPTGAQAVTRLLESIDEAARLPNVDPAVMGEAADLVTSICSALDPFDSSTIVHGDLTFENIMWNGTDIAAMLDFEFARPAPADLDLDVLLRFVSLPQLHVAPDYEARTRPEDYAEVPWWLAEDYPELFAHPRQFDRSRVYSVAWDVREMLAYPPSDTLRNLHRHHPYRRLTNVLRGSSYLDRFNGEVVHDF
jgi:aminoglycoside phosphotransferase